MPRPERPPCSRVCDDRKRTQPPAGRHERRRARSRRPRWGRLRAGARRTGRASATLAPGGSRAGTVRRARSIPGGASASNMSKRRLAARASRLGWCAKRWPAISMRRTSHSIALSLGSSAKAMARSRCTALGPLGRETPGMRGEEAGVAGDGPEHLPLAGPRHVVDEVVPGFPLYLGKVAPVMVALSRRGEVLRLKEHRVDA